MKEIKAIIRPSKLLEVTKELHEVEGLSGVTVSEIKGFGKSRAKNAKDKVVYEMVEFIPRIQLEVVVDDVAGKGEQATFPDRLSKSSRPLFPLMNG